MCRSSACHYELCNHDSNVLLEPCQYYEHERTSAEMNSCLFQLRQPASVNNVNELCPACVQQQSLAAAAAAEFWERMNDGQKDAQRRAKEEKKAEKKKNGNFLWRKVLSRISSKNFSN